MIDYNKVRGPHISEKLNNDRIRNLSPVESSCFERIGHMVIKVARIQEQQLAHTRLKHAEDTQIAVLASAVGKALTRYAQITGSCIRSSFFNWVQTFDFSRLKNMLENLDLDRIEVIEKICLTAMYESKWFPYAAYNADMETFSEIIDIINTSRGATKNREKRIDKVVFAYYTKTRIRDIKRDLHKSDLEKHIIKILGQAIEAYLRGEYVLTISCLAPMWEDLIRQKGHIEQRINTNKSKTIFSELLDENEYEEIFGDYFEQCILSQCNEPDDVVDGVPNRHGVAHGWYKKYPNKKAALNAILFTHFLVDLDPIVQMNRAS